jgi:antitoxin (DNA-binding transcriptional repressor) of toxin-antitoxin stability system
MRTLTIGEFKAQFSAVLTAVQAGESVIVCYGRKKQRVAALVPYAEFAASAGKRPLGLLKGKGGFTLFEDFALSDDEFLAA